VKNFKIGDSVTLLYKHAGKHEYVQCAKSNTVTNIQDNQIKLGEELGWFPAEEFVHVSDSPDPLIGDFLHSPHLGVNGVLWGIEHSVNGQILLRINKDLYRYSRYGNVEFQIISTFRPGERIRAVTKIRIGPPAIDHYKEFISPGEECLMIAHQDRRKIVFSRKLNGLTYRIEASSTWFERMRNTPKSILHAIRLALPTREA
jgi:hypothetical protein